jgi:cytochrome b
MPDGSSHIDSRTVSIVKVWDLPTRLFHWLLVLAVAIGAVTGFFGPEWLLGLHVWSGYGLAVLILFRLVWAFLGSEYSRVSRFAFPPRAVIGHLRDLLAGRAAHSIGHNPAGSAMIFALAGLLTTVVATGLMALGGQEKQGMLAGLVPYSVGHAAKEVHEVLTVLLLVLVGLHVAGVAMESLRGPWNLVAAMITGRKRLPPSMAPTPQRPARPLAAALVLAAIGLGVGTAAYALTALPPRGLPTLAANPTYAKECGACHYDFHPSLLPAAQWVAMMASLDDHFGEDASLGDTTRGEIAAWLAANASETWDTEAANAFRRVSPEQPMRVTETRFWKRRHRGIPDATFASKAIRGKLNCIACHRDARSGRFADQSISIPKETS